MSEDSQVTLGSGNIFADLEMDCPDEELLKARLAFELRAILKRHRLAKTDAAERLDLRPCDMFTLVAGDTSGFSINRLLHCLDRLGYEVELVVRQAPRRARMDKGPAGPAK